MEAEERGKVARRISRSIYLTPEQDSAVMNMRPEGMSVSDFLVQAISSGVEKVQPLPVEHYDEWGLINQLTRDDGDHSWVGRVKAEFFSQDIPRAVVSAAEQSGFRGTRLVGSISRHIKPIDLEPSRSDEYVYFTAADAAQSVKRVTDAYVRRSIIGAAGAAVNSLLLERDPADAIRKLSESLSHSYAEERGTDVKEALRDMAIEAKRDAEEDAQGTAVKYNWPGIDLLIPRMGGGEVHVLAARTNVGKSLIITNVARNNAIAGVPVAIFSLEMRRSLVAERLASVEAAVASRNIDGQINLSSSAFIAGCQAVGALPIHIDDRPALSAEQIGSALMSMLPRPRLAIVDYLGLMRHPKEDTTAYAVGQTMKSLLSISKRMGMPIIVLCQINRVGGAEEKPKLVHIRDSGDIEQDASTIILARSLDDTRKGIVLEVAKNRVVPRFGEVVVERVNGSARLQEVQR